MRNKDKANWELTLKNILYFVDEGEQENMLTILKKYNDQLPDGPIKDWFQKLKLNAKKTYYEKVDYLVEDILNGGNDIERKKLLSQLLDEIKPIIDKAERNFWDKLKDLFKWS